jgi:hypothetical protein
MYMQWEVDTKLANRKLYITFFVYKKGNYFIPYI